MRCELQRLGWPCPCGIAESCNPHEFLLEKVFFNHLAFMSTSSTSLASSKSQSPLYLALLSHSFKHCPLLLGLLLKSGGSLYDLTVLYQYVLKTSTKWMIPRSVSTGVVAVLPCTLAIRVHEKLNGGKELIP